jgi:hypothetical protein
MSHYAIFPYLPIYFSTTFRLNSYNCDMRGIEFGREKWYNMIRMGLKYRDLECDVIVTCNDILCHKITTYGRIEKKSRGQESS